MIKLVAFDWNGTLIADTGAVHESTNEVLKLFNLERITLKTYQSTFDTPVKKAYVSLGVTEDLFIARSAEIAATFHSYYEPRIGKVRTRANVRELLTYLNKNKIDCVILSNHIEDQIKKQLKRLNLEKYFRAVLSNQQIEMIHETRNKKDRLEGYMNSKNLLGSEILIVGDTLEEIEVGKELGVFTVAITRGLCSVRRLKKAKPDFLIYNLKQIKDIIDSLS